MLGWFFSKAGEGLAQPSNGTRQGPPAVDRDGPAPGRPAEAGTASVHELRRLSPVTRRSGGYPNRSQNAPNSAGSDTENGLISRMGC